MNDPLQTVDDPGAHAPPPDVGLSAPPHQHIGRYRIERLLGKGGFGLVYLAHDDQLQRQVAIKVPHAERVERPEDAAAYLTEARTVANLDHPHIVPVYDVGSTADCPCFVVSKYIDGTDLSTWLKQSRLSLHEAVELTATVAEALHHAHKQGLVHRDVKPGNILLDRSGQPFVADFGLALREQDVGQGPRYAGTPAYMSPEQARGEGHRVDGRSDIFSLGVVFYLLLTGRRPFQAASREELLEQIASREVRPPRQWEDAIPRELERICLKALSRRASERYTTAKDMAEDLRHVQEVAGGGWRVAGEEWRVQAGSSVAAAPDSPATHHTPPATLKIVPKGLRSFDAADADFFLELLPGARDRDGLPDSIRFWKTHIEATDADGTFSVGLLYGPSGCGKSSLVKAGLLPRLAKTVTAVYLEATGEETEARLLKGLRRQLPDLPGNLSLGESLAGLRRGRYLEAGQKVLLVLDQFEQWLHAKRTEENTELVEALRQCDGRRVQAIVMVRDDFWLAVSRFMQALEIVPDGDNSRLVDLFDLRHARKVLLAFGRAFGALPEKEPSREQDAFLDRAVAGLAQDGKVISVRLALFAEMVKGKPWTPATLREVGGTEGVGVTFLEETFTASTAPPQHRLHQKAAQAVLKALLPESGTNIKGHMRSQQELLDVSGYASRPKDFADVLRILDSEIRLITPTDPEGKEDADTSTLPAGAKYYQLTHDYLVHSLRDWLTRKQKETRRGRAELLLADRAAVWNARPENRQLPSLLPWLQIRWYTRRKQWTAPQRQMMRKASRYHALRGLVVLVVLTLLGWGGYETHGTLKGYALRDRLLDANTAEVPTVVQDMAPYRRWGDPLLRDALQEAEANHDPRKRLHVSLALLPVDATQVDYLYGRLLEAKPLEVPVIRDFLDSHKDGLRDRLWAVVENPEKDKEAQRLRAAAALAKYDPQSERWAKVSPLVVDDLVRENPVHLLYWSEAFRPVKNSLLEPLSTIFRERTPERAAERSLATNLLADYAAEEVTVLANLLMEADDKQFAVLYPKLKEQGERSLPLLTGELDKQAGAAKDKMILESKGMIGLGEATVKVTVNQQRGSLPASFEVRLQAEKTYRLTMDSKELDSFLVLQDRTGKDLGVDDDGGGDLNSLLVYTPSTEDTYTVFAASLKGTGSFVLKVVEQASGDGGKEKLAKRQANAAVALLRMHQPAKVWALLKHSPDPRVRSYLIERLGPMGADAGDILKRLDEEPDVTIRRALVLSLGEYGEGQLASSKKLPLIEKLLSLYERAPDAGLHGAAEWLLRRWGEGAKMKALDAKLRTREAQLHEAITAGRTEEQKQRLAKLSAAVEEIQTRYTASEKALPLRQAAWEKKRLEQPFALAASLQDGLIAHYPLDEAEGTAAANAVKGEPGATYQGAGKPEWGRGVLGRCLRLNGQGTAVGKKPLDLEGDQSFSYGCWFQYEAKIPMILLSTRDGSKGYRGFDLSLEGDHQLRMQIVGEKPDLPAAERKTWSPLLLTVITKSTVDPRRRPGWHQVMVTYDGSKKARGVNIFVDGKDQQTDILDDNFAGTIKSTVPIHLGSRQHQNYRFRGQLDDVRIYNRRLTEKEARQLYEAGIQALVRVAPEEARPEQRELLTDHYRSLDEPFERLAGQLSRATKALREAGRNWVRRWYVNGQGQTMVVIPGPVEFVMGSPSTEEGRGSDERQHKKCITRTFAIAAKAVTKEQFLCFLPNFSHNRMLYYPEPTCPIGGVTWYEAAAYCNWLSKQEGIARDQWCYETDVEGRVTKLKENYLSLTGYRLPTEAEMEYATRAGALTSRHYGETEELLPNYAWYLKNAKERTWPVGWKKPNDLGLFDVQGNVYTWCQEAYHPYPGIKGGVILEDKEGILTINNQGSRVLRGGSFLYHASNVRCAIRNGILPSYRSNLVGFRPARTFTP